MKLTGIKTFVVGNPPPHFGGRYFVFVKLETDNGSTGLGEAYCVPFSPHLVAQLCEDMFARYLEGRDPHDIESMWRRVYSAGFTQHPDLTVMGVLSALEMACWDIVGKEAGQPVYKLLGGQVHEKLRAYTYIYPRPDDQTDVYHDPDLAAERAQLYLDMGFTALKFDPAGPYSAFDGRQLSLEALDLSERFCRKLREAVGNKADLLFGTHGQMTAAGAIRLARRLEKYDPLWLEEPVPPDAPEEMAKVARATSIPIATGERLATKYDFARLLDCGGAAILQMNLGRVGGLLEAKKIAGMAEVRHVQIAPHLYCGPVVGAANVQLATCSPNFLILESIEDWSGFHAQILKTPMQFEQGHVIPPTAPGLGIELDEEVAAAHPYTGDMLHLDMTQHPVSQ
ncbi:MULTISPECIES: mandelate racemase/muconate lactonizing enzyme family protein [unclassified Novosphingobium]|uniref:mandelate racemase/muconate lactonizing enzyme family protein n=1 Tax=unclassified Novosphingobium TaxID=2644732 RepID=UPI000ED546C9|nr:MULTISPECIES: mandelate racemase/muconate lactonizing enzyme family protein [unclassified Novosphingobium]HCF24830.1 isomerase [Novosphingobium sp.]HQV01958.1 mandelate racemase/muconate lactonizing enzyme family protein [Novosphingobium sp.]